MNGDKLKGYDYLFKVILLGDSGVGKSSIVKRHMDKDYNDEYNSTIGVDFCVRIYPHKDKLVKLQIWDTAGQERFRSLTKTYHRGAHGVFIVCDLTSHESLQQVNTWLEDLDPKIPKILIGNKCDRVAQRVVTEEEASKMAKKMGMPYFETSAKTSHGIDQIFQELIFMMYDRLDEKKPVDSKVILDASKIPRNINCCV